MKEKIRRVILNRHVKKLVIAVTVICLLAGTYIMGVNFYVIFSQDEKIFNRDEIAMTDGIDYVVVLGCGIRDGKPSHMLEDRLYEGMAVAESVGGKLLLSGDDSGPAYDEVTAMVNFCIENGFDEENIVTDRFGFSTGESIDNLLSNYPDSRVIIITQKYHLYRALFICERQGIEGFGVASNPRQYRNQIYFSLREIAARNKDFIKYLL